MVHINSKRAGHHTTRVELKCHVSTIYRHRHKLVSYCLHEGSLIVHWHILIALDGYSAAGSDHALAIVLGELPSP